MEFYFGGIKISRRSIVISMFVVLIFAYVSPFSDFASGVKTYFKSLGMSKAELREEVIRSYLHSMWRSIDARREYDNTYRIILIPQNLSNADIIKAISNGIILDYLNDGQIIIKDKKEISKLDSRVLSKDFMIIFHTRLGRELYMVRSNSIRQLSAAEFNSYYEINKMPKFQASVREQLRGYGKYFFSIEYPIYLHLSCCDGKGNYWNATPEMSRINGIDSVKRSKSVLLPVSSSGDILERNEEDHIRIYF